MNMIAPLQVRDLTARLYGDDPDRPVLVGRDGTRVVLLLDAKHAEDLAKVMARARRGLDDDFDPESDTWLHAITALLTAKTEAEGGTPVDQLRGLA